MVRPRVTYARGAEIASTSIPPALKSPSSPNKILRRWILRVSSDATEQSALENAERFARDNTLQSLLAALGPSYGEEQLARCVPLVELEPIDENHILVHALHPSREEEPSDAVLVAMAEILKAIDVEFGIEDIQGVPKRFWLLVSPPIED